MKRNKLSSLLLAIILFYLVRSIFDGLLLNTRSLTMGNRISESISSPYQGSLMEKSSPAFSTGNIYSPSAINTPSSNRMIERSSTLSLLVKNVRQMADGVISQAEVLGGFMIQSNFSNPGEAPTASLTVRVPANNLQAYLSELQRQSIRVVSEELTGNDITDQYTDIQARLSTLNATKAKFEAIYNKATTIQDILDVQNRIIELQNQIDQLKGQQLYMEKSSEMARVTVYLSTDELALPYAPDTSWRPSVVFKQAIRSLIMNLQGIAGLLIWIAVYAIIWLPVLIVILLIIKKSKSKKATT